MTMEDENKSAPDVERIEEAAERAEEAAVAASLAAAATAAVAAEDAPADRGKVYGDGETLAAQLAAANVGIVTLEARVARLEAVVARQGW